MISTGVCITSAAHGSVICEIPFVRQSERLRGVSIGENCWIAANAVVIDGVTIGANSVIGAGAVVTRTIPSGVFAAGVPARVLGELGQV
ncbi:hypothetical protein C0Z10_08115 [Acidipropionibacterium jensenii]|uniref:Acyltransferase n=2 Tax=Acidipropionibacterium jensenii TaxID=1749 RepID=A0A3T0S386_9ACTN|nr:hypothetical protein C0Z10_08115 [Acidipropionibacterium jensenii]